MTIHFKLEHMREELISLETKGGLLNIKFRKSKDKYTDIYLSGKVKKVFDGVIKF